MWDLDNLCHQNETESSMASLRSCQKEVNLKIQLNQSRRQPVVFLNTDMKPEQIQTKNCQVTSLAIDKEGTTPKENGI